MSIANRLTDAQAERLAYLIEECSHVSNAAAKILRHGYYTRSLTDQFMVKYREELQKSMEDLKYVYFILLEAKDLKFDKDVSEWVHK